MEKKVKEILERDVNPMLATHGGGCELIEVTEDNVVKVKLKGACGGCPGARATLKGFVEQAIRSEIPEINRVEDVF
ncbi:MAG: NifU family protein [bacterium]